MRLRMSVGCVAFAVAAMPAAADQKLVTSQSQITFASKQMGVPVDGRFRKFNAEIMFEPKRPEASKIALTIDLSSVSLGSVETEVELAQERLDFRIGDGEWQDTSIVADLVEVNFHLVLTGVGPL